MAINVMFQVHMVLNNKCHPTLSMSMTSTIFNKPTLIMVASYLSNRVRIMQIMEM
jgi:hypothetical protein